MTIRALGGVPKKEETQIFDVDDDGNLPKNEVIRKSGPPPPPKIDLGERRAAPPPPPTLSHRPQPSSYRSRDEYEASYSKARPDVDDYLLMRRSELDDRTERRSWSREPDWDGDDGRGYRAADASATHWLHPPASRPRMMRRRMRSPPGSARGDGNTPRRCLTRRHSQ